MGTNCGLYQCYTWGDLFRPNESAPLPQITVLLIMIYAEAIVYFVLGGFDDRLSLSRCCCLFFSKAFILFVMLLQNSYLDAVIPRENGVVEHPLFFLFPLRDALVRR